MVYDRTVAQHYKEQGFQIKFNNDATLKAGIDLICEKDGKSLLIKCDDGVLFKPRAELLEKFATAAKAYVKTNPAPFEGKQIKIVYATNYDGFYDDSIKDRAVDIGIIYQKIA